MKLVCSLQLHDAGQQGKGSQAQQQQLDLDLATLFGGKASTFEDLGIYVHNELGLHAASFSTCVQPVLGPLKLHSNDGPDNRRFYLTSDGGIYKAAERSSGYVPDSNEMMQPYAESLSAAAAMATAASAAAAGGQASGAWGEEAPTLRISALTSQPGLPFEVYIKELTGKTLALKVHEGMAFKEVKTMMLGRQGPLPDEQRSRYMQQRLIHSGSLYEDAHTVGDVARRRNVPITELHGATFYKMLGLKGGMYHATSGRRDNDNLGDDSPSLTEVTVLSYTGVQVELSVLMVDSPGGEHFGAEDLARLAHKALEQQAL